MQLSESEWKVMKVVWERHPASVRDVFEALQGDKGWAYSTVKTMLTRLADKGALEMGKRGNVSLFEPRVSANDAKRSALRTLLNSAFDGTFGSLVHHLFAEEKLSRRDREELSAMLSKESQRPESEEEP